MTHEHLTDLELSMLIAEHACGYRWYRSTHRHLEPRRFLGQPDLRDATHPTYPAAALEPADPTDAIHPHPYQGPLYASSAEGNALLTERLAALGLEDAHHERSKTLRADLGDARRRRAAALAALDLLGVPLPTTPLLERCHTCAAADLQDRTCHHPLTEQRHTSPDGQRWSGPLHLPNPDTFGCLHYVRADRRVFPDQFPD